MKVTIEEINGKQCTVIRKPFDAEWVKGELNRLTSVLVGRDGEDNFIIHPFLRADNSARILDAYKNDCFYSLTILPALPKHPTPEDASLLYRYMAEGLCMGGRYRCIEWHQGKWSDWDNCSIMEDLNMGCNTWDDEFIHEITHVTLNSERVEIAITKEK